MKKFTRLVLWLAIPLCAALAAPAVRAQSAAVSVLAGLGGTPDGYNPQASLISGGDGFYYGTTQAGGPANLGTVYKITAAGVLTTLYAFSGSSDGALPKAGLVSGGNGFFYGTTSAGGTNGNGTIFKISPAGVLTNLHSFSADNPGSTANADGASPQAALVSGGDGYLYGMAEAGGTSARGTVFRISPAGAFNVVHSFATGEGAEPVAALTLGGDGFLYGTTQFGGVSSSDLGTVFRVTAAGSLQTLYSFTNGTDGGSLTSSLVLSNGKFYGLTNKTFFSITTGGLLTTLATSTSSGQNIGVFGGLIAGSGGNFYATAGIGILQVTATGTIKVLASTGGIGVTTAPLLGTDGNLYGVAAAGATNSGGGTVYQVVPSTGALKTLHAFAAGGSFCEAGLIQDASGDFYGVASQGGAMNGGSIFGVTPGGETGIIHDFDPDTEGSAPRSSLFVDASGNVYGMATADGPEGGGTLFQVVPGTAGTTAEVRRNTLGGGIQKDYSPTNLFAQAVARILFDYDTSKIVGVRPYCGLQGLAYYPPKPLIVHADTLPVPKVVDATATTVIYGYCQDGGSGDGGTLFSIVPGSDPVLLHSFGVTTGDGSLPEGLTQGKDGNYYGITYSGGTAGLGTIFKLGTDGTYSVLYSFTGQGDGGYLETALAAGSDGILYGVTQSGTVTVAGGNTGGYGTIFSITPTGVFKTLYTFPTTGASGEGPTALVQAKDGKLYGTTQDGVLFSCTTTGQFTVLYRQGYDVSTGKYTGAAGPSLYGTLAPLIQAIDGNLYGTTPNGGPNGAGEIFKVVIAASTTPTFFSGDVALSNGVYYLAFPNKNYFGYYSFLTDPAYIYHFDLGYEYVFDANDGKSGVYLYDFASKSFFYTSPGFPFPYLYDFTLKAVLYYYPNTGDSGHYTTDPRYFYNFATGKIITK